jgi:two-component system chemotaxis response regulator CheB
MSLTRGPVRVLVVDDSAVVRRQLSAVLGRAAGIEVIATARDGVAALRKLGCFRPDVVSLDLETPEQDGLEVLQEMVLLGDPPVIVVGSPTDPAASRCMAALGMGAVDLVAKPRDATADGVSLMAAELLSKVRAAAGRHWRRPGAWEAPRRLRAVRPSVQRARRVVAIGAAMGGPAALGYLLSRLPASLPAAILIVQHMPEGFSASLARHLDASSPLAVSEAGNGEPLLNGHAYIAPGGRHLRVASSAAAALALLEDGPEVSGHRPSVDLLFRSVAQEIGARSVGVLLTGMGDDGVEGMESLRAIHGRTLVQDEDSSVVFGTAQAAVLRGCVDQVLPLERLAEAIAQEVRARNDTRAVPIDTKEDGGARTQGPCAPRSRARSQG